MCPCGQSKQGAKRIENRRLRGKDCIKYPYIYGKKIWKRYKNETGFRIQFHDREHMQKILGKLGFKESIDF
jgi:adenylate cyclase class IV